MKAWGGGCREPFQPSAAVVFVVIVRARACARACFLTIVCGNYSVLYTLSGQMPSVFRTLMMMGAARGGGGSPEKGRTGETAGPLSIFGDNAGDDDDDYRVYACVAACSSHRVRLCAAAYLP